MSEEALNMFLDRLEMDQSFLGEFIFSKNLGKLALERGLKPKTTELNLLNDLQRRIRENITTSIFVAKAKPKLAPKLMREKCSPNGPNW
jgi:hypothetical protein